MGYDFGRIEFALRRFSGNSGAALELEDDNVECCLGLKISV